MSSDLLSASYILVHIMCLAFAGTSFASSAFDNIQSDPITFFLISLTIGMLHLCMLGPKALTHLYPMVRGSQGNIGCTVVDTSKMSFCMTVCISITLVQMHICKQR